MEERGEVFSAPGEITLPGLQACEFGLNLCTVQDFQALLGGAFVIVAAMITAVAVLIANERSVKAMRGLAEATKATAEAAIQGVRDQEKYRRDHEQLKNYLDRHLDAEQIAAAFIAEITAILSVIRSRSVREHYEWELKWAKIETEKFDIPKFSTRGEFCHVYLSHLQKLGKLVGPLPENLVDFYTRVFMFLDFNQSVCDGFFLGESFKVRVDAIKTLIIDIEYLESAGNDLIKDLQRHRQASEGSRILLLETLEHL